jgi:hypothetical protein
METIKLNEKVTSKRLSNVFLYVCVFFSDVILKKVNSLLFNWHALFGFKNKILNK